MQAIEWRYISILFYLSQEKLDIILITILERWERKLCYIFDTHKWLQLTVADTTLVVLVVPKLVNNNYKSTCRLPNCLLVSLPRQEGSDYWLRIKSK